MMQPPWPATAFEIAAEAVARGATLVVTPDRRLSVNGPAEVEELRPLLRERRDEIVALLESHSRPIEVEALESGPYRGFLMATNRVGPDPVRAGYCLQLARVARARRDQEVQE